MKKKQLTNTELIEAINKRIDRIEELVAWRVLAKERFKVGQRVQFSAAADRKTISDRRKNGVRTGTVKGMDAYWMDVLLDGYKQTRSFHHMFFDPMTRKAKRKGARR